MNVKNVLMDNENLKPNNEETYKLADFQAGFEDVTGLQNHQCEIKCVQGYI